MAVPNIWYISAESGEWESSEDSINIKFHTMLHRMQTWLGEKPFNANDGIDYLAVFNRQALLIPGLEDIAADYYEYFDSITITLVSATASIITVKIEAVLLTGNKYSETITI